MIEESRILTWTLSTSGESVAVSFDNVVACLPGHGDKFAYLMIILHEISASSADSPAHTYHKLTSIRLNDIPECFLAKFICTEPKHLQQQPTGFPIVHVIVSTAAGTGRALAFYEQVLKHLLDLLNVKSYETHTTSSASSISEFATQVLLPLALEGKAQTVILLSGDGGLVDMIKSFASCRHGVFVAPIVAMIPVGTGNASANSSQFRDMTEGLSTLVRGHPRPLPMLAVRLSAGSVYVVNEGHDREPLSRNSASGSHHTVYGAVVLSWGLHASLVADSDTTFYRKFGSERFKMVATDLLKSLDENKEGHYRGKIRYTRNDPTTGELKRGTIGSDSHMYTLVTLVSHLEKNYNISPLSRPLDGQLHLVHIGHVASGETMRLVNLPYENGRHVNDPNVTYEAIESLRIDFEEPDEQWRRLCLDGQIIAVERDGWVEVERSDKSFFQLVSRD